MLTLKALQDAFNDLGLKAVRSGRVVEIAVYGGSAIVLTFPSRLATKDVDAVLLNDSAWVRAAAVEIAHERREDWPEDWLNDGVKGWLSQQDSADDSKRLFRSYPSEDEVGLRVFVAVAEYLFAMRCMAMRIGGVEVTQDRADITLLAEHLGITTADAALAVVSRFYPSSQITPRTASGSRKSSAAHETELADA